MKKPIDSGVIWEKRELKLFGFVIWSWVGKKLSNAALLRRISAE